MYWDWDWFCQNVIINLDCHNFQNVIITQFRLTLPVARYRLFSFKDNFQRKLSSNFGLFYCDKGLSIKHVRRYGGGESVQKHTGAYRGRGCMQILQRVGVKVYTNRFLSILRFILLSLVNFQGLHRCCIPVQVFITLYRSNLKLWRSLNFKQLEAMKR